MRDSDSPRCLIVGATTLPGVCAKILTDHGLLVHAVVTDDPEAARSAAQAGVSTTVALRELRATLEQEPVDYLFSVNNLELIDELVLALVRRSAINFHDGPLPAYAGVNATSWGILEGATSWGVTWHLMTAGIDDGAILLEEPVEISATDTSLSLNMKCFEAAVRSFPTLARRLVDGHLAPRDQDPSARRYFTRLQRPPALCSLRWGRPADELHRLVRALDFGVYPNRLGTPKILLDADALAVSDLRVLNRRTGLSPGSVLAAGDGSVTVATGTSDVELLGLRTMEGKPLAADEIAGRDGLRPGARLAEPSEEELAALTDLGDRLARHEDFWAARLVTLPRFNLPRGASAGHPSTNGSAPEQVGCLNQALRTEVGSLAGDGRRPSDAIVATLLLFLGRLAGERTVSVAYSDPEWDVGSAGSAGLVAASVPLIAELGLDDSLSAARAVVLDELDDVRRRGPYLRDLLARRLVLRGTAEPLEVAIRIGSPERPITRVEGVLTLVVHEDGEQVDWIYSRRFMDRDTVSTLSRRFDAFLSASAAGADRPLAALSALTAEETQQLLTDWNDTSVDYPRDLCLHELIEQQASRTPDATALLCDGHELSYGRLIERADALAARLRVRGVKPGHRVGICLERSVELVVALLATLKAGGAYVPLDPTYPADRIRFMIEDAEPTVVVCQQSTAADPLQDIDRLLVLNGEPESVSTSHDGPIVSIPGPEDPAYVIYTSGSTGKPKGVIVSHRNVLNFIHGMDARVDHEQPGTFLAVTSISFDISVLELFWSLARGFRVVVYTGAEVEPEQASPARTKGLDFSLFFFASGAGERAREHYRLLTEAVKFADVHGFSAVWTPERHFHAFGGLYPNPSVTSAAIAAMTQRLKIRAGSVVSPLHNPLRIAEEWSFVDNLSEGRVGISFASGWQPDDFVLAPENFADRKQLMFRQIELVQRLWRGESVALPGLLGKDVDTRILPRPIQPELPVWITAAGSPETFRMAGEHGFGLLTHLLGQSVAELGQKIEIYREGLAAAAGRPGNGNVVLMLHTFVGSDNDEVRELVRAPMKAYLKSSVDLIKRAAWTFPTFKQQTTTSEGKFSLDHLSEEEIDKVLDFSFERYFETSGLLGDPEKCVELVRQLAEVGVGEVACLVDFHDDADAVLSHLPDLDGVRRECASASTSGPAPAGTDSIPVLIERHGVTHMQCTPSLAVMLVQTSAGRRALGALRQLLVGGEALPPALAEELTGLVGGEVVNMYGPTETTIWSSTYRVDGVGETIPIGHPIANTQLYILDEAGGLVPPGIAGELFIGGEGVAVGYHNRPELTAERFVPDPFSGRPGARMYRTGDIARHREDGAVEFLGRVDHQVKLRGYRIELGEIEAALGRHPEIDEAVVIAVGNGDLTAARLVAYVTGRNGSAPSVEGLRAHLEQRLPEFMIPSSFEVLEAVPRTPNQKVDRNALPAPGGSQTAPAAEMAAAEDDVHGTLTTIWENALGVSPIGADENFFDLGGHSLLAMQVFAEIGRQLHVELPLTTLLRAPTIQDLASMIEDARGTRINGASASAGEPTAQLPTQATLETESVWRGARNRALQELAKVLPGAQSLRVRLHRARGVRIGRNVWVGYGVVLETGYPEHIEIEDNVTLSVRATIIAHFMETVGVKIEHDVFLGPGVIVLPSVVIGHGAVVTAGSVVSQSIPPMTVAQGNPAVPVAKLDRPLKPNAGTLEAFSRGLSRVDHNRAGGEASAAINPEQLGMARATGAVASVTAIGKR